MIRSFVVAAALALVPVSASAGECPQRLVVHTAPFDTNGDGGSWAWGQSGGKDQAIRAKAPSRAARILGSLAGGERFVVRGRGVQPGIYVMRGDQTGRTVVWIEGSDGSMVWRTADRVS